MRVHATEHYHTVIGSADPHTESGIPIWEHSSVDPYELLDEFVACALSSYENEDMDFDKLYERIEQLCIQHEEEHPEGYMLNVNSVWWPMIFMKCNQQCPYSPSLN